MSLLLIIIVTYITFCTALLIGYIYLSIYREPFKTDLTVKDLLILTAGSYIPVLNIMGLWFILEKFTSIYFTTILNRVVFKAKE